MLRFSVLAPLVVVCLLVGSSHAAMIESAGGNMDQLTVRGTDMVTNVAFGGMNLDDSGPISLTGTGATASGSYNLTNGIAISNFAFNLGDSAFADYAITTRFQAMVDLTYTLLGSLATSSSMHSPCLFMRIQDITAGEMPGTDIVSQYLSKSGVNSKTLTINTMTGSLLAGHVYKLDIEMSCDAILAATGTGNASISLVPEPATLSLLALSGLALARRRHG